MEDYLEIYEITYFLFNKTETYSNMHAYKLQCQIAN